ncbi:sensor histidine kinase [Nonomuraea sp. KC401]|uniref:sensor histidine kinase n=1 Tax=unclassified Nonomuraea TaxID=2593643 RepID=UPI0010FDCDA6|nr:sensor histidine kinase [Nonomuraea sp. KC401]NBE91626.1 sensor histidine kinase [Nonomuraea sp. K271]TLF85909.1 sensor histidine kinase [Nonomuraea sp. KC401]
MRPARSLLRLIRFFRRPKVFDRTLVLVLGLPGLLLVPVMLAMGNTAQVLTALPYLAAVVVLLMRRHRPVLVTALVAAIDVVGVTTDVTPSSNVPTLVAYYSLGRYTAGRTTAIAAAGAFAAYATVLELDQVTGGWVMALFNVGVPVGIGQIVRLRSELHERGRREAADAAVSAERRRIARELHDVVAHHITVINALVGGARATLPAEQEVTRNALESAEQTARQAMSEMRRLLDVLRADGHEGPDAATGVGADRLPTLIKQARSAGLPAHLTVTGEPVSLPAVVDHAVYRIVQEALTNTRKHAPGARASVRLAYEPDAVEVEVVDDGSAKGSETPGFGLGGMAERVALCGGRLSTGPRAPQGGFRVHARIPLETP